MQEITPFIHGKTAWHADLQLTDNPYSKGSIEAEDWVNGWLVAESDEHFYVWQKRGVR